ncbi:MAG: hypothetical protein HC876_15810 [Chloroflexaceae bacterium]|nr:hypothetical protein [Chloroflexaceae bacterium]
MIRSGPRCPRCGTRNNKGRMFCEACGSRLTRPDTYADTLDLAAAPPPRTRRNATMFWLALLATVAVLAFAGGAAFWQLQPLLLPDGATQPAASAPGPALAPSLPALPAPTTLAPTADSGPTLSESLHATGQAERRVTATRSALNATAQMLGVGTAVAQQLQGTVQALSDGTAIARSQGATQADGLLPLTLFDLPIYPGAQRTSNDDPFQQGAVSGSGTIAIPGSYERVEQQVYITGDPASAVISYYDSALSLRGWQSSNIPAFSGAGLTMTQQTWQRGQQRLIITLVQGDAVAGGNYMLMTLVTGQS